MKGPAVPPRETAPSEAKTRNMRAVRSKNTKPEYVVRRLAHALGYRFRLHQKDLPGRPDVVFPGRKAVILVHGCFWHGHDCAKGQKRPATNQAFWDAKLDGNRARDMRDEAALRAAGWRVLVVWECETKDKSVLEGRLRAFLA
ncbi:very short patch repair endonuclease [Methylorubrum extorquens]